MKNSYLKYFSYLIFVFIIAGCSGAKETNQEKTTIIKGENRERALDHFVNGSIYDQQGDYARAILEYQDALRYDNDPAIYYALSKSYAALGKIDLGIDAAKNAIKLDPKKKEYYFNLADLYLSSGDLSNMINTYKQIISLDSSDYKAWNQLARIYQIYRDYQKAIETYEQIVKRFGSETEVLSQLSFLYSLQKKPEQSIILLRQVLELEPGNTDFKKQLGGLYVSIGNLDSALTIYEDVVEQLPTDVESRAALSHIYLIKQNYEKLAEQFDFILKDEILPLESQLRYAQLVASFIQKDSAVTPYALQLFEKIKTKYPDDWRPYFFIGLIASSMKDNDLAIQNFEDALKLDKSNPDPWIYLASLYFEKQEYRKVIDLLNQSLHHISEELRIYLLMGISYQRINILDSAALNLERAYQIDEKNIDVITSLALVYDDLKNYEESDSLYERGLKLYPDNHLLLNNYAYSLSVRGLQLERALKMSKRALEQQPKNPSYLDTYGWIFYQLGNYNEALRYIKAAIEEGEVSAIVLEHLGDVYYKLGDTNNALKYWKEAYTKDKDNQDLKKKIEKGSL